MASHLRRRNNSPWKSPQGFFCEKKSPSSSSSQKYRLTDYCVWHANTVGRESERSGRATNFFMRPSFVVIVGAICAQASVNCAEKQNKTFSSFRHKEEDTCPAFMGNMHWYVYVKQILYRKCYVFRGTDTVYFIALSAGIRTVCTVPTYYLWARLFARFHLDRRTYNVM